MVASEPLFFMQPIWSELRINLILRQLGSVYARQVAWCQQVMLHHNICSCNPVLSDDSDKSFAQRRSLVEPVHIWWWCPCFIHLSADALTGQSASVGISCCDQVIKDLCRWSGGIWYCHTHAQFSAGVCVCTCWGIKQNFSFDLD